ncbi:RNA 2',3'-cyclic phosphodiesterase [Candidatus Aerophobetes bacterium]|nr:RNA 2',3'-cyclic phosphodiesterase [Candidatus Aerophobetes bacterium]
MRVFIALNISSSIREKIAEVQKRLKETENRVRWVNPAIIHLTLKFLGEIREEKLKEVFKAVEKVSSESSSFLMKIEGMGVFPNFSRPRVIWAGVREEEGKLQSLVSSLAKELKKRGFPEEKRGWTPHLTIGRIKFLKERKKLIDFIQLEKDKRFGEEKVNDIEIMQSQLTPKGSIYKILKKVLL